MKKLYIIEGIPGSGKTTCAGKFAQKLKENGEKVNVFTEGDLHPADMAWNALLTKNEYKELCEKNPQYAEKFSKNSSEYKEYRTLAYSKVKNLTPELFEYLESKEIYDNRVDKKLFCDIHYDRWKLFGEKAENTNIFECVLLQNQINELKLFHMMSDEEIFQHISKLLNAVRNLHPVIVYLNPNTDKSIERAASERVDENNYRGWENGVTQYIENSPYGKKMNYVGTVGMKKYFDERRKLELSFLTRLDVPSIIVPVDTDNSENNNYVLF